MMKNIFLATLPPRVVAVLVTLLLITVWLSTLGESWRNVSAILAAFIFASYLAYTRNPNREMQAFSFVGAVYIWFGVFFALLNSLTLFSPFWNLADTFLFVILSLAIAFLGFQIHRGLRTYIILGKILLVVQTIALAVALETVSKIDDRTTTIFGVSALILYLILSVVCLVILFIAPKKIAQRAE